YGVLRSSATVVRLAGVSDTVSVVALDHGAVAHTRRWDRTSGGPSAAQVSRLLGTAVPTSAPRLPAGTRRFTITAIGADPQTVLAMWLRRRDGGEVSITLHAAAGLLSGAVPHGVSGPLTAVAFGVEESPDYATHHAHAVGEGNHDQPLLSG